MRDKIVLELLATPISNPVRCWQGIGTLHFDKDSLLGIDIWAFNSNRVFSIRDFALSSDPDPFETGTPVRLRFKLDLRRPLLAEDRTQFVEVVRDAAKVFWVEISEPRWHHVRD